MLFHVVLFPQLFTFWLFGLYDTQVRVPCQLLLACRVRMARQLFQLVSDVEHVEHVNISGKQGTQGTYVTSKVLERRARKHVWHVQQTFVQQFAFFRKNKRMATYGHLSQHGKRNILIQFSASLRTKSFLERILDFTRGWKLCKT